MRCVRCLGDGQVECEKCDGAGIYAACQNCDRDGMHDCPRCDGSGEDNEDEFEDEQEDDDDFFAGEAGDGEHD